MKKNLIIPAAIVAGVSASIVTVAVLEHLGYLPDRFTRSDSGRTNKYKRYIDKNGAPCCDEIPQG